MAISQSKVLMWIQEQLTMFQQTQIKEDHSQNQAPWTISSQGNKTDWDYSYFKYELIL